MGLWLLAVELERLPAITELQPNLPKAPSHFCGPLHGSLCLPRMGVVRRLERTAVVG